MERRRCVLLFTNGEFSLSKVLLYAVGCMKEERRKKCAYLCATEHD